MAFELRAVLGPSTVVARSVNGRAAMWGGFTIDRDAYWLQADVGGAASISRSTWLVWIGTALLAALLG